MKPLINITYGTNIIFFLFGLYATYDTASRWAGGRADWLGLMIAGFLVIVCGASALTIRHLSRRQTHDNP